MMMRSRFDQISLVLGMSGLQLKLWFDFVWLIALAESASLELRSQAVTMELHLFRLNKLAAVLSSGEDEHSQCEIRYTVSSTNKREIVRS
ncbi:hypothetical protein BJY00DRAFT_106663 [Aspergillus carlsbadensis]|nr:hypothetical protein BJY00DRAFT_106663 [Aspergillus carlsbadensis]